LTNDRMHTIAMPSFARRAPLRFRPNALLSSEMYVANFGGDIVNAYDGKKIVCSIGPITFPSGVNFDRHGTLWVVNQQPAIMPFAAQCGNPKVRQIVYDYDGQPADIGFGKNGAIYALEIYNQNIGSGAVAVIPAHSRVVSEHLTDPSVPGGAECIQDAVDRKGSVYMTCMRSTAGGGEVVKFAGGSMPGAVLSAVQLQLPGGIRFDAHDNMIVEDQELRTASLYAPPYTKKPFKVVSLQGQPVGCALSPSETQIACTDVTAFTVDIYTYPAFKYEYSVHTGAGAQDGLAVAIQPSTQP
jgi:hypothetical protein